MCFHEGEIRASTRQRDLPERENYAVFYAPARYVASGGATVAYCPRHRRLFRVKGTSEFHLEAARRARNCEEFDLLETAWSASRSVAWKLVRGEPLDERDIRRLVKRTKNPKKVEAIVRYFAPEWLEHFKIILAAREFKSPFGGREW